MCVSGTHTRCSVFSLCAGFVRDLCGVCVVCGVCVGLWVCGSVGLWSVVCGVVCGLVCGSVGLWVCGLWSVVCCGLWFVGCGLWSVVCGLNGMLVVSTTGRPVLVFVFHLLSLATVLPVLARSELELCASSVPRLQDELEPSAIAQPPWNTNSEATCECDGDRWRGYGLFLDIHEVLSSTVRPREAAPAAHAAHAVPAARALCLTRVSNFS